MTTQEKIQVILTSHSLRELAQMIGVHHTTVIRWRDGVAPRPKHTRKLHEIYKKERMM